MTLTMLSILALIVLIVLKVFKVGQPNSQATNAIKDAAVGYVPPSCTLCSCWHTEISKTSTQLQQLNCNNIRSVVLLQKKAGVAITGRRLMSRYRWDA